MKKAKTKRQPRKNRLASQRAKRIKAFLAYGKASWNGFFHKEPN